MTTTENSYTKAPAFWRASKAGALSFMRMDTMHKTYFR